ncbi:MAG: flagellar assembly protein FliH, partial [Planctomycetales bacterium]
CNLDRQIRLMSKRAKSPWQHSLPSSINMATFDAQLNLLPGFQMALVIKTNSAKNSQSLAAFNYDDIAGSGEKPLSTGTSTDSHLRSSAATELPAQHKHLEPAVLDKQVALLKKIVSDTAEQLHCAHQQWLVEADNKVLQLAVAIAERIIRRQLDRDPEISLQWIRESLELLSSSTSLQVFLNPNDEQTLGKETKQLAAKIAPVADVKIVADQAVLPGECRVETRQGLVDHTIQSQLQRITEELEA